MEGQNSSQEDRLSGGFRECYHVMVVDDEPENLELLERRLSRVGYDVSTASSAREALGNIEERQPDIILLDITMPDVSGRQMLLILRKTTQTHTLPVIMVSGLGDSENIAGALREGANDYVTKPIDMDILLARMETHLRLGATIRQLETQKELLQRLAAYDELTGVYNRRSMFDALDSQFGVSRRMNRSFSILMIDLDNFKSINDSHGHAAGDEVLKGFCNRMKNLLRSMDILSRYGGEEF
ncbi:diguanylate cyclase, partial [Candidatus Sumerlaeota bacterium]|nr:diguanylate cyclase [Candidatus Sumerlaeota bacterium]